MLKRCGYCGRMFHAKRKSAKYCSPNCRLRAYRSGVPILPDSPPVIPQRTDGEIEDTAILISEARQIAGALIQQSNSVPLPLRAKCSRVGHKIMDSLEREGW